ncbi:MAG: signal peptide peptidase SppA [Planctomycetota bacterium]|jgi:protease-4
MQHTPIFRRLAITLSAIALLSLGACMPSRLVIDLDPELGSLHEQTLVTADSVSSATPKIALIRVDGFIANTPMPAPFGMAPNPTDELVRRLDRASRDDTVRAIVLVVNSPGGTITGAETMYNEIIRFRESTEKPVVVSMGEVATSGGYYITLAADFVYANPTTLTGSIGVLMQMFNISEGLSMIGISSRSLTSGPNKALASPLEPEVEAHYQILQDLTDEFYARFVEQVNSSRESFDVEDTPWAVDGRVVSGTNARAIGLIDDLGGVREAFAKAKELASIDVARLVRYTPARTGSSASPFVGDTSMQAQPLVQASSSIIGESAPLKALNIPPGFYYLWIPGVN